MKIQLFKLIKKHFKNIFFCFLVYHLNLLLYVLFQSHLSTFSVDLKVWKVHLKITTVLVPTLFDELPEPLKYTKRNS